MSLETVQDSGRESEAFRPIENPPPPPCLPGDNFKGFDDGSSSSAQKVWCNYLEQDGTGTDPPFPLYHVVSCIQQPIYIYRNVYRDVYCWISPNQHKSGSRSRQLELQLAGHPPVLRSQEQLFSLANGSTHLWQLEQKPHFFWAATVLGFNHQPNKLRYRQHQALLGLSISAWHGMAKLPKSDTWEIDINYRI